MPQQINFFTPILLTHRRYFSAQTLLQTLAVLVFLSGGLSAFWIDKLEATSAGLQKTLAMQSRELTGLQLSVKTGTGSQVTAATGQGPLQVQTRELQRLENLIAALQAGVVPPGQGHSARMALLAQTIPTHVWLTALSDEVPRLEVSGFTWEPALLNAWIDKLAANPLLKGQSLQAVTVESVGASLAGSQRPLWSFHFVWLANPLAATTAGKP